MKLTNEILGALYEIASERAKEQGIRIEDVAVEEKDIFGRMEARRLR